MEKKSLRMGAILEKNLEESPTNKLIFIFYTKNRENFCEANFKILAVDSCKK
jgi:hypothetical protein